MCLKEITIGGFRNLRKTTISFEKPITALIAPNNYGKSNLLDGIEFFDKIIHASKENRKILLHTAHAIPINKYIDNANFFCEVTFDVSLNKKNYTIKYSIELQWPKTKSKESGKIINETFSYKEIKQNSKFKVFLRRNNSQLLYISSEQGRCDTASNVDSYELGLEKLLNYDNLFYVDILKKVYSMRYINSKLLNVDFFVGGINISSKKDGLNIFDESNLATFLYYLKTNKKDKFELLINSIKSLIPNIEQITPMELDLKKLANEEKDGFAPFLLPEKLYDIRIKEHNNNQSTSIKYVSTGTKRILSILSLIIGQCDENIVLVGLEELENSIHPVLLQKLLIILDQVSDKTKLLITSHSPTLTQYLSLETMYCGIPNSKSIAIFNSFRKTKTNTILKEASDTNLSIGEYIFDFLLQEETNKDSLLEYFDIDGELLL